MKKFNWGLLGFIILVVVWAVILSLISGCTKTAVKRIEVKPDGTRLYTAFTHYECLMKSEMDNAEVVIDGPYRHYAIGKRTQSPDSNSIEALLTQEQLEFLRLWGVR